LYGTQPMQYGTQPEIPSKQLLRILFCILLCKYLLYEKN
jgi:hypothetical protein